MFNNKIVLTILIALLLFGCSEKMIEQKYTNATAIQKQIKTPEWVTNPKPKDTITHIYAIGKAQDKDAAIKIALSSIALQLGISQEISNSNMSSQINSPNIEVLNYKILKTHKANEKEFAVLLEMDKNLLTKEMLNKLENIKNEIIEQQKNVTDANKLIKYNTYQKLAKKSQKLLPKISIIAQLDPKFEKQKHLDFVAHQQELFLNEMKQLKFYVTGNRKSAPFITTIKNYLSQKHFAISQTFKDAVVIKINTFDNMSRSNPITSINLEFIIKDKGNQIGGKSTVLKEPYFDDYNKVYSNAAIHLEEDIKRSNINEVIGLNLAI